MKVSFNSALTHTFKNVGVKRAHFHYKARSIRKQHKLHNNDFFCGSNFCHRICSYENHLIFNKQNFTFACILSMHSFGALRHPRTTKTRNTFIIVVVSFFCDSRDQRRVDVVQNKMLRSNFKEKVVAVCFLKNCFLCFKKWPNLSSKSSITLLENVWRN